MSGMRWWYEQEHEAEIIHYQHCQHCIKKSSCDHPHKRPCAAPGCKDGQKEKA